MAVINTIITTVIISLSSSPVGHLFLAGSSVLCVGGPLVSVLVLLLLRDRPFELGCLRGACSALFSICIPRDFWRVVLLLHLYTCYSL